MSPPKRLTRSRIIAIIIALAAFSASFGFLMLFPLGNYPIHATFLAICTLVGSSALFLFATEDL